MSSRSTLDAHQLSKVRGRVRPAGVAEQAADVLRQEIFSGILAPGTRLSEEALGAALGISRNTLREAFRLLAHEGLVEHRPNRGVFICSLGAEDAADLFQVRRALELSALRFVSEVSDEHLADLETAVSDSDAAAEAEDWIRHGTANLAFHRAVVALADSPRMNDAMQRVLAQMRLVFQSRGDQKQLHAPYLGRNRLIFDLIRERRFKDAERELARYLDEGERRLLVSYR
jgi:DNA-binding GntR family transcriptional regulator